MHVDDNTYVKYVYVTQGKTILKTNRSNEHNRGKYHTESIDLKTHIA